MSRGSKEGAGECLGRAEGPRVEEAGVSLSPARPLFRLGKVGRGRAGISALGEGIPELERKVGALHALPERGVSPVHTDKHTRLPRAREPRRGDADRPREGRGAQGWAEIPAPAWLWTLSLPRGAPCAPGFR